MDKNLFHFELRQAICNKMNVIRQNKLYMKDLEYEKEVLNEKFRKKSILR